MVAISDLEHSEKSASMANQILQTLSQQLQIGEHKLVPSASLGISIFPNDGGDPVTLMKNADIAMYSAESVGRSRFCFYDIRMTEAVNERVRIEGDLRQALQKN